MKPFSYRRNIVLLDPLLFQKDLSQVLFVSNHLSAIDPYIIATSLDFKFFFIRMPFKIFAKPLNHSSNDRWMVLLHYSLIPQIYYFVFSVITFPLIPGVKEKLSKFQKALSFGYSGLFFPEGKRSFSGDVLEIKRGISILRKDNPDIYFVFVFLKKEESDKWYWPFQVYSVAFSAPSLHQSDNYQDFVKEQFEELRDTLLSV